MGSYIAKADILNVLSQDKLDQLTVDAGEVAGAQSDARIDEAISTSEGEIDAYCGTRYTVPLSSVTSIVSGYAADMAIYHLYARRRGAPEDVEKRYERAIAFFRDVSAGKAALGANAPEPENSSHTVESSATARMFSREKLGGW